MSKERKRCEYPMSMFYIYEDEVPENTRVSETRDCVSCLNPCEEKHCLITESNDGSVEKEKKCENYCPSCGSGDDDIEWQCSEMVGDYIQEQRGTCKKCGCKFYEESELVYRRTVIGE